MLALFRLTAASAPRGAIRANPPRRPRLPVRRVLGSVESLAVVATARSSSGGAREEVARDPPNSLRRPPPTMLEEVLELWSPGDNDGGGPVHLVDGTVGPGGHALAALNSTRGGNTRVLGIDLDPSALELAGQRRFADSDGTGSGDDAGAAAADGSRLALHRGSFAELSPDLLRGHSFPPEVRGVLIECGTSSAQFHSPNRGFTFRKQGPLDMRFDAAAPDKGKGGGEGAVLARDVVNQWSASEMASLFGERSDEPYADEIAAGIVEWRRSEKPGKRGPVGIRSTLELRYIVEEVVEGLADRKENDKRQLEKFRKYRAIWRPRKKPRTMKDKQKLLRKYEERTPRYRNHVARVFRALRTEVNDEIRHLRSFFQNGIASRCLEIGGRLVVIALHPVEDRLVKEEMDAMVSTGAFRLLTPGEEGLRPTSEEIKISRRSKSAVLRAVERIH